MKTIKYWSAIRQLANDEIKKQNSLKRLNTDEESTLDDVRYFQDMIKRSLDKQRR